MFGFAVCSPPCHNSLSVVGRAILIPTVRRAWNSDHPGEGWSPCAHSSSARGEDKLKCTGTGTTHGPRSAVRDETSCLHAHTTSKLGGGRAIVCKRRLRLGSAVAVARQSHALGPTRSDHEASVAVVQKGARLFAVCAEVAHGQLTGVQLQ